MLRWAGALLIFAGGLWTRWAAVSSGRREQRTRLALAEAFESMEAEIRLLLTPVPALLRRDVYREEAARFFACVSGQLARGAALSAAWRDAAETLPLDAQEREAVAALGARLDGGEDSVCAALALSASALRRRGDREEARRGERERLITSVCVSVSLFLTILLL